MKVLLCRVSHAVSGILDFHKRGNLCGNRVPSHIGCFMDTWEKVLNKVEEKVGPQSYNTWFKPTQFIRREGSALYIRVPNSFVRDWLNEHIDVVVDAARSAGVGEINVVYMIEEASAKPRTALAGKF